MKRSILVFGMLSIWLICTEDVFSASKAETNVFLCAILDTRPNSEKQWNILRSLLLESVHNLREGDKLQILAARPGNPSRKITTVLGKPDGFERDMVIEVVSAIRKEFLFGADLAKAMKAAFDSFRENGSNNKCCLIVLTDGKVGNGQAGQIRKLNSMFRARGWPVCITCDGKEANRQLLAAGNRGEIDLRFIDRPLLSQWIGSVRLSGESDVVSGDKPGTEPTTVDKAGDNVIAADSSLLQPSIKEDNTIDKQTIEYKGPVDVRIVDMPPFTTGGSVSTRDIVDANDVSSEQSTTPEDTTKLQINPRRPNYETKQAVKPKLLLTVAVAGGGLLAAGLCAAALFVLKDGRSVARLRSDLMTNDTQSEHIASHIVAYAGDQRQDLGDMNMITEITIGRDPGSTVYIDNENVSDTHVRIFKGRKALKAQNLAGATIIINGTELPPKAKTQLSLPADIELVPGMSVSLLTEPVELDMEVSNHENEIE